MRRRNWISGGLALALTLSLAGCSLARPEKEGLEQDRFIGYHLVYEPIPGEGEVVPIEDENWVEYGSETLDLGAYGSTEIPREILIGERQENGDYLFPGKEGLNFFFPVLMTDYEEGEPEAVLTNSQLEITQQLQEHNGELGDVYTRSGVAYFGLPLGEEAWPEEPEYGWTAYEVYQREDGTPFGTVYLTGDGSRYAGAGGDFGFGQERVETEKFNGETIQESGLKINVDFKVIPRMESVTLRQYSADHVLLTQHTLTAREAQSLTDDWIVTMAEETAYTLIVKDNADGTQDYELFPEPTHEFFPRETMVWFLDERGMGVPVTVELEQVVRSRTVSQ